MHTVLFEGRKEYFYCDFKRLDFNIISGIGAFPLRINVTTILNISQYVYCFIKYETFVFIAEAKNE